MDKLQRDFIVKFLLKNPIDRTEKRPYLKAAEKFNTGEERIRRIWRTLRERGDVESSKLPTKVSAKHTFKVEGDKAELTQTVYKRIKTLKDLIAVCEIDTKEWDISSWECNKWEVGAKDEVSGGITVEPLFQVKAKLVRKKIDTDLEKQKDEILKELFDKSPSVKKIDFQKDVAERRCLFEISVPDLHIGKLGWREETGEDYDLRIAEKRYKKAIYELLSRVNTSYIDKILFPIGNDMINIDSPDNVTTAGTPQSVDGRFPKIIKIVKRVLIEVISELATIAPVDVLVVPGNHDNQTMFMMGEMLEAYYHNHKNVNVLNTPNPRKYYKYGVNGFQYTHGNEEKHIDLGIIFATEAPRLWASTKYRVCKLGHLHKTKKVHYVSVDEFQGFQVEVLPSLSGTDIWHKKKGYQSLKAAKAFLYHKDEGKIAEFTYTL